MNETSDSYVLISRGPSVTLKGEAGYKNGVGVLDELCRYFFSSEKFEHAKVRNVKMMDLRYTDNMFVSSINSNCTLDCHADFKRWLWADAFFRDPGDRKPAINSSDTRYRQVTPTEDPPVNAKVTDKQFSAKLPVWLVRLTNHRLVVAERRLRDYFWGPHVSRFLCRKMQH